MRLPKPRRTKRPSHIPALSPLELDEVQRRLDALPTLGTLAKQTVMRSLRAAANPQGETAAAAIKTLKKDEQARIQEAKQGYAQTLTQQVARGKAALAGMDQASWDLLVEMSDRRE